MQMINEKKSNSLSELKELLLVKENENKLLKGKIEKLEKAIDLLIGVINKDK